MLREIVFQEIIYTHYMESSAGIKVARLPDAVVTLMYDRTKVSKAEINKLTITHRDFILREGYCPDKRIIIIHAKDVEKFADMVDIRSYDRSVRKKFCDTLGKECQVDDDAMCIVNAMLVYVDKCGQL